MDPAADAPEPGHAAALDGRPSWVARLPRAAAVAVVAACVGFLALVVRSLG